MKKPALLKVVERALVKPVWRWQRTATAYLPPSPPCWSGFAKRAH